MNELEIKAGIKIGEIALKEGLSCLKTHIENRKRQNNNIYMQRIYRKREKAALMETAVALARANRLNTSNTQMIMQTLKEVQA